MAPKHKASDDLSGRRSKRLKRQKATRGADGIEPWHGHDILLSTFRLKDLQRKGYIDYQPAPMPATDADIEPEVSNSIKFLPHGYNYHPIHHIFRRQNWIGITDHDYTLLEPSLRLASCFLNEPCVTPFFTGMLNSKTRLPWSTEAKWVDLYQFYPDRYIEGDRNSFARAVETWKLLADMRDCIEWKFGGVVPDAWAVCRAQTGAIPGNPWKPGLTQWPGGRADKCSSRVSLSLEYLQVFRDDVRATDFPKAQDIDPKAAKLRTQLFFAITLVHEFCHAFQFATAGIIHEPFLAEHRVAELGLAFETAMFGYIVQPMGLNSRQNEHGHFNGSTAAPYGLSSREWPGIDENPRFPRLASAAFWGFTHSFPFAVSMSDVHRYFTKQYWDTTVSARGTRAFRWDRTVGLAEAGHGVLLPSEVGLPLEHRVPRHLHAPGQDALEAMGFKLKNPDLSDTSDYTTDEEQPSSDSLQHAASRGHDVAEEAMEDIHQDDAERRRFVDWITNLSIEVIAGIVEGMGEETEVERKLKRWYGRFFDE